MREWNIKINQPTNIWVKKIMNMPSETEPSEIKENIRYFKLLFIGKFVKLNEKFCKEGTNIRIYFSKFELASLFSTEYNIPYGLKSYVIYKFLYAGCNVQWCSETYRNISTETHEHLETDKNSNIYRHRLKILQCISIYYEKCFPILDSARTKYTLKLKEGMYKKWLKSSLNKQVKCILYSTFV